MTYKLKSSKKLLLLAGLIGLVIGVGIGVFRINDHPTQPPTPHITTSGYFTPDGRYTEIKNP